MTSLCTLCQLPAKQHTYHDHEKIFCCAGCHAVYQILSVRGGVEGFENNPLFQQAVRSGIISNPEIQEQIRSKTEDLDQESEKLHLEIQDLWCLSCTELIRLVLLREKGIRSCYVDYCTDLAFIEFNPKYIAKEKILRLISRLGYHFNFLENTSVHTMNRSLSFKLIVAAFFSLNIMMFSYPIYASYFDGEFFGYAKLLAWASLVCALPVVIYSAWPIWRRLVSGLKVGFLGMECLVGLGVAAAMGLSIYELIQGTQKVYFDSLTLIIVFLLLGKLLESKAKFAAKDSLFQLMRTLPRRGRKLFEDGKANFVPIKEISLGDRLVVLMGERIVLDGIIEEGSGACDESIMTGESWPVAKQEGSMVLSGSLLQHGRLVIKVTSTQESSALFKIIEMVSQEMGHKSVYIRAADPIVRWFVPFVISLAIATGVYCWMMNITDPGLNSLQTAFIRAISVVLISCPCAIGIAAPLAESYLIKAMANLGAIVRNRGCLPYLAREDYYVFDKTGTVTEGKFSVLEGLDISEMHLRCLKTMVEYSNHPISVAVNLAIDKPSLNMQAVEEIAGKGIKGEYQGKKYYFGSASFLNEHGIALPVSHLNKTTVWFGCDQKWLATLILGDRIRPSIHETLAKLESIHTILLSGDSEGVVAAVSRSCGFHTWKSQYSPLQKKDFIDSLRRTGKVVAMVGDGVNDALALSSAHVGISMLTACDISIQVSDILLTTDRLSVINDLRHLAKKGRQIINQNLFWAFFYNVIGIGLAVAGMLTPIFAAFAMVVSSFIVLVNAQRIKPIK